MHSPLKKFFVRVESKSGNPPDATLVGVSHGASRTLAGTGVALLQGNSPWSAGVWRARVWSFNTLLLTTDIAILTVGVNHTFRSTACDGVWFGDEARKAPTDGVASDVGSAGGGAWVNCAARVRIARIRLRALD